MIGDDAGTFVVSTGIVVGVYAVLLLFSVGYNLLIAWLERKRYLHGVYVALAVVAGVLVTLGGCALIHWQFTLLVMGAFVCSGTPMVLGSIWRSMQKRGEELIELRKDIR